MTVNTQGQLLFSRDVRNLLPPPSLFLGFLCVLSGYILITTPAEYHMVPIFPVSVMRQKLLATAINARKEQTQQNQNS